MTRLNRKSKEWQNIMLRKKIDTPPENWRLGAVVFVEDSDDEDDY